MNFIIHKKVVMSRDSDIELAYPKLDEKEYRPVGGLVSELKVQPNDYKSSPRSISGAPTDVEINMKPPQIQKVINEEPNCCERTATWLDQKIIWYKKEYMPNDIFQFTFGLCIGLGLIIGGVFLMHAYNTIPKYDCDDLQNACTFYIEDDIEEDFVINCIFDPFPICQNCTDGCLRGKFSQTLCFGKKCAEDEKENANGYQTGAIFMFVIGGLLTLFTGFFVCIALPMLFLKIARKIFFCY